MWAKPEPWRSEDGVALVFALAAVVVVGGLITVLVATSMNQTGFTRHERDWETSLHAAEAGIDQIVLRVNEEDAFTTNDSLGTSSAVYDSSTVTDEYQYALDTAADLVAEADADSADTLTREDIIFSTGGSEFVGFRPKDPGGKPAMVIFGVGYVPSYENPEEVRAVKVQFDRPGQVPSFAILTQGDTIIGGSAQVTGDSSNAHSNGDISDEGNTCDVEGESSDPDGGGEICQDPQTTTRSEVPVTVGRAIDYYDPLLDSEAQDDSPNRPAGVGWFDLCPDGSIWQVKDAPADNPDNDSDGVGDARQAAAEDGPCDSDLDGDAVKYEGRTKVFPGAGLSKYRGWEYKTSGDGCKNPDKCWVGDHVLEGVYYIHQENAYLNSNSSSDSGRVTMMASCDETDTDSGSGEAWRCVDANGKVNGNMFVAGKAKVSSAYGNIQFFTDRDYIQEGGSTSDPGSLEGLIAVREQFALAGNATLNGAIIAADESDTTGSWVQRSACGGGGGGSGIPRCGNRIAGGFTINYDGGLTTALPSLIRIIAWNER